MKTFLMMLIATTAFATAAAASDLATSTNGNAAALSAKPTMATSASTSMGPTGAHGAAQSAGGSATAWKVGDKSYAFQGSMGGCHFSGDAGPDGYHMQKAGC